jgi:hypothetical protein
MCLRERLVVSGRSERTWRSCAASRCFGTTTPSYQGRVARSPASGMRSNQGRGTPMSATASGGERRSGEDGQALRVYLWTVTVLVLGLLVGAAFHERASLVSQVQSMIAWACVVAVADLLPVWLMGRAVSFSVSLPVTLAAGMILGPLPAAIISTVGAMDPREIRREITPVRAAYNRAQVAASVWTASTVFHAFGVAITSWPLVVVPALAALVTDFAVNMTLVTVLTAWRLRLPVHTVPKRLLGESPLEYVSGYVSLGFIAALQALTFHVAGIWD